MQILPSGFSFHFSLLESTSPPLPHNPLLSPNMSVVGIDLGAQTTKIGVARNKGIDIVRAPRPRYAIAPFFFPDHRDLGLDCHGAMR